MSNEERAAHWRALVTDDLRQNNRRFFPQFPLQKACQVKNQQKTLIETLHKKLYHAVIVKAKIEPFPKLGVW